MAVAVPVEVTPAPMSETRLITYLLDRGVLTAAELVHTHFHIETIERKNVGYVVHTDHPVLVVKCARDPFDNAVEYEAAAYRALTSGEATHLQFCIPRIRFFDNHRRVLVMDYVPGAQTLRDVHVRTRRAPAYLGRAAGELLAALHVTGARPLTPLPAEPPWALTLSAPSIMVLQTESSGTIEILRRLQAAPGVLRTLELLLSEWRNDTFCHGDVRLDNLLVRPGGQTNGHPLVLVDWELYAPGEALWDVSCLIASYLELWLAHAVTAPRPTKLAQCRQITAYQSLLAALWAAWHRGNDLSGDAHQNAVRATQLVGARLLQSSLEYSQGCNDPTRESLALLEIASACLTRPHESWVHLLGLPLATTTGPVDDRR